MESVQYFPIITPEDKFDAVILADGTYPSHSLPLSILYKSKYVVCCDGACVEYIKQGHIPDAIVGDLDSIDPQYKIKYSKIIHHIAEQDDNDLSKAIDFCINLNKKNIAILGATGKREDHSLGNISHTIDYIKKPGVKVKMITDHGYFIPIYKDAQIEAKIKQQVSIFDFGCKVLNSEGLVWQIRPFTNWWQGTLNEVKDNKFIIHADGYYLIYLAYPQ